MPTINLHGHNYRVIRPNTQQAERVIRDFEYSSDTELSDVYGRYSKAKENAYEYCRARERECDSYNGVITGHNSMTFSYAFTTWQDGHKYLVWITKCNDYAIDITNRNV